MEDRILYKGGTGEIVEKKSRFIATLFPVKNEEEALEILDQVRKKYYDARHNCFAYIIGRGNNPCKRSSDDGEPSGTAGHPMLDILEGENITDVLAVVTRYFGGTLLGTGGLVRAYSAAMKEGLNHCTVLTRKEGMKVQITMDYSLVGKLQYLVASEEVTELNTEYTDLAIMNLLVPKEKVEDFQSKVIENTAGKVEWNELGETLYGTSSGQVILLTD
jgi:uncharacterized YigZ family protein